MKYTKTFLFIFFTAVLFTMPQTGLAADSLSSAKQEGEKLKVETAYFQEIIKSGDLYLMNDAYDSYSAQIAEAEKAIGRVSGQRTRENLLKQYIRPAKIAKERVIYEISEYRLIYKIGLNLTRGASGSTDIAKLSRLSERAAAIKAAGKYEAIPAVAGNYLRAAESSLKKKTYVKVDAKSRGISQLEYEVFLLTNFERVKNKLSIYTLNMKLSGVARKKSEDMYSKNYFNHTSPTYGSPFDMMQKFGVNYGYAGENIAKGYTGAHDVVKGWMNSPGHRANILKKEFAQIGTGYKEKYWTQMFID
ncbi:CAP domain-containing protein [Metabacillus sp. FJAT-52054]|uniref:CAP domain-containing protein n=1 Tax=Metabacillus sediminis TaxID=3117746 RepID=A0ABZ2NH92_9BACI